MCDVCVIESVKERMISRRSLFKTAAAGAAVAAVGAGAAVPAALAAGASKVEDMTHEVHEKFPTYFGEQQFFYERELRKMPRSVESDLVLRS